MTAIPIPRYFNPALSVTVGGVTARFLDGEGLNIRFSVKRTLTQTPDTASVAIFGLDPDRADRMGARFNDLGKSELVIQAGYDSITPGLFTGDIRTFRQNQPQGADLVTMITADDGGDAYSDVTYQLSNAGMTALEMFTVATELMDLTIHPSALAIINASNPLRQGAYTAVGVGKASELLTAAARRIRARWWIRDGQLFLGHLGLPDLARPAVLITEDILINNPTTDGSGLTTLRFFMNPNVVPGSQVSHRARLFRVESCMHAGETRSGSILATTATGRVLGVL